MEKIYMEENKSQKQKQQQDQKRLFNISIVLSFVVAAFAIVSLMTVAFDKPSYAAPDTETVPDDITFYTKQASGVQDMAFGKSTAGVNTFAVPLYYRDESYTLPLFCVEHLAEVDNGIAYSKNSAIEDYGLLYILNNSYAKSGVKITSGNEYMEAWATQVAIWLYLDRTTTGTVHDTKHAITEEQLTAIQHTTVVELKSDVSGSTRSTDASLYSKIDALVEAARNASSNRMLTVTKAAGETTSTSDNTYFQSPLITVTGNPASAFKSYDITISGVEGAKAVTENGEDLALTNVAPGTKFYVRVPKNKVTAAATVNVGVNGTFEMLEGNYYTANSGDYQKVVTVTGSTKQVSSGVQFDVAPSEDTGVNKAQTIYFIGLVVLLCGIGIVYANAKPSEIKQ